MHMHLVKNINYFRLNHSSDLLNGLSEWTSKFPREEINSFLVNPDFILIKDFLISVFLKVLDPEAEEISEIILNPPISPPPPHIVFPMLDVYVPDILDVYVPDILDVYVPDILDVYVPDILDVYVPDMLGIQMEFWNQDSPRIYPYKSVDPIQTNSS